MSVSRLRWRPIESALSVNPKKKFQRNCNEEERIKKNAKKQITESVGSADVKVDDDAPTFLEQLQQEVNQLMNA